MAADSFGLFIQQLSAADDELKVKVVQIVFDLLMVQDISTLVSKTMPVSLTTRAGWPHLMQQVEKVVELVRHVLANDDPTIQALACEGVAKLMLAGMISDETVSAVGDLATGPAMADGPGTPIAGFAVLFPGERRQPSFATMLDLFLACLLLFVTRKSAAHAQCESKPLQRMLRARSDGF
jgi:hypothetical protein